MIFTIKMAMFAYVLADFRHFEVCCPNDAFYGFNFARGTEVRAKRSENDNVYSQSEQSQQRTRMQSRKTL